MSNERKAEAGFAGAPGSARPSPIYLTKEEAERDFDEIVETIRLDLARLRGKIHDVQRMWPGWRERVDMADGGLTCIIMALYSGVEEYKSIHKKAPNTEISGGKVAPDSRKS
jgi:hypothetical protein